MLEPRIRFRASSFPASGVDVAERWAPASTMLEAALDYQRLGFSVFPLCRPTQGGGCSSSWHHHAPKDAGKTPLVQWTPYQLEAPSVDQIDKWWTQWPEANIAIVTGAVTGVVVFDADGPVGFQSLKARGGAVPTWFSRTGRPEGGWQYFYQHPGQRTRNGVRVLPGLDVRGDGGYAILQPSLHFSGRQYEWLTSPQEVALAPLPPALLEFVVAPPTAESARRLAREVIPVGQRNDFLYRLGRSLGATGSGAEVIHAALIAENRARCRPPLPDYEVHAIAEHAITQPDRPEFRSAAAITPGVVARRRLSLRMEEVLRDGDTAGRYRRPDAMIEALALGAHNAGWSEAQLFVALMDPMNRAGKMIRRRPDGRAVVAKSWEKAQRKAQRSPPITDRESAQKRITTIEAVVAADQWCGRAGETEKAVLEAVLRRARTRGSVTLPLSCRTVALDAGRGRSTVNDVFDRLERRGYLEPVCPARRTTGQAAIWTLRMPPSRCTTRTVVSPGGRVPEQVHNPDSSISATAPSAARPKCTSPDSTEALTSTALCPESALGRCGRRGREPARFAVWRLLDGTVPRRPQELASVLDRKLRIVQQHLADLKREELVVQARDGWCRSAANPDDVETRLNVAAVQREQKRQQQYQQERIDDARSRGSVRRRS